MTDSKEKRFLELYEGEVQNRAFALMYTERSSTSWGDNDIEAFWRVYYDLEVINQRLYKPYADKFGLDMQPTFFTSVKTSSLRLMSNLFPEYMLNTLYTSTVKYLEGLKEMENLAPEEDKDFYRYVVEQEAAQVEALRLVSQGEAKKATKVLADYVNNQIPTNNEYSFEVNK
ncbi:hypothetical protein RGQ13_19165 [Thalassotalea psychrophila]|uniref:Uncharacterized protein n=1 Tax=Thalassotalea psychrophila TaxID=3065647 RepID=A0ABY9TUH8_9GAMM|nr:hypothetical protein RGQ13_19165 [Colwelliaceae bacterium SQ149]